LNHVHGRYVPVTLSRLRGVTSSFWIAEMASTDRLKPNHPLLLGTP